MLVQLRSRVANAHELAGKTCTLRDVTLQLRGDCDVYKPDGTPLVMLRRGALSKQLLEQAYPALHELRKYKTDNRGAYAGTKRIQARYGDGTIAKNTRTRTADGKVYSVASAIVGYFDKQGGRIPFCRETAFTGKEPAQWATVVPMVQAAAALLKEVAPSRYDAQLAACAKCPSEYVIPGTPFTTLTVNNNVAPAGTHKDAGDYKDGLGVISVLRRGRYTGAWLVFPEYRVGANLQDGDVLFFNSHDWHGVTAMHKHSDDAERISVVYYMREKIQRCLPAAEQLAQLQQRQGLGG